MFVLLGIPHGDSVSEWYSGYVCVNLTLDIFFVYRTVIAESLHLTVAKKDMI